MCGRAEDRHVGMLGSCRRSLLMRPSEVRRTKAVIGWGEDGARMDALFYGGPRMIGGASCAGVANRAAVVEGDSRRNVPDAVEAALPRCILKGGVVHANPLPKLARCL